MAYSNPGAGKRREANASLTVPDVAAANASATYGAGEQALMNELKTKVNAVLAELRKGGVVATPPPPHVLSLSPNSGPLNSNTQVTITGTGFDQASVFAVQEWVGSIYAGNVVDSVDSPTEITATMVSASGSDGVITAPGPVRVVLVARLTPGGPLIPLANELTFTYT